MLWHYTVKYRLDAILRDNLIKPAAEGVRPGATPAVWFSSNQDWEESANMAYQDDQGRMQPGTKDTTYRMGGGLARIGVLSSTAPMDWNAFKAKSGIKPADAKAMYQAALGHGARPGEWFAVFGGVPRALWAAAQVWDGANWIPFDETGAVRGW
jgi:hypothetical protein